MIKIQIEILGTLIRPFGKSKFEIECKQSQTIKELLAKLNYKKSHISYIVAIVNGAQISHEYELQNNDLVILQTIVGGG